MKNINSEKAVRNKITIISFVCSLLVIWIHTYNAKSYALNSECKGLGWLTWSIENFWSEIIGIAVPTFFLISGFLFFRTFSWDKLFEKYKTRAKSILLPYLIWCTLYYLYFVILTNVPIIKDYISSERYVPSFINWVMSLWPESYYSLWFLKNLICFIIATPIIYIALKNYFNLPTGFAVVLMLVLNSIMSWIDIPSGLEMYAIGGYIAVNHKKIEYFRGELFSCIGLILAFILFVTRFMVYNLPLMVVFIVACWYALDFFNLDIEMPWWVSITFFTYVFHDMVLEMLEKLFLVLGGTKPLMALLDYIFMPVITFFVIALVASVLKRIKPLWNVLCGFR